MAVSANINMQTANNLNNKAKNASKKLVSIFTLLRMGSLKRIRLFGEFRSGSGTGTEKDSSQLTNNLNI
jgi:hypothetical protein